MFLCWRLDAGEQRGGFSISLNFLNLSKTIQNKWMFERIESTFFLKVLKLLNVLNPVFFWMVWILWKDLGCLNDWNYWNPRLFECFDSFWIVWKFSIIIERWCAFESFKQLNHWNFLKNHFSKLSNIQMFETFSNVSIVSKLWKRDWIQKFQMFQKVLKNDFKNASRAQAWASPQY